MQIDEKLFEYLKSKIENFQKAVKSGSITFTCPNLKNHKFVCKEPTCTVINGSNKVQCLICGWKGTFFDIVRLLEDDKKNYSDAQITEYLINSLKVDMYKELDVYQKYGWTIIPCAKNSKNPIEGIKWEESQSKEKIDWIKWLNNSYNIGLRTGEINGITVIDVDNKTTIAPEYVEIRKSLLEQLEKSQTLSQNSRSGGKHYFFKYDKEIPQVQRKKTANRLIDKIEVDIRNDGGYIMVQPSQIDKSFYNWVNINDEIKVMPAELKTKILELLKIIDGVKDEKEIIEPKIELPSSNGIITLNEGDGRNNCLVSFGGVLINKFNPEDTTYILHLINKTFMTPQLPYSEIKAMIGSLKGYKVTEQMTQEKQIYECLKILKCDITAKNVVDHTGLKSNIVNKYLAKIEHEGILVRTGRGIYDFKDKIEWVHGNNEDIPLYPYKVPFFNHIANFHHGDIILLGGKSGKGKTHQAMNIINELKPQGIKPYYFPFETGSRYKTIANTLGLQATDFYVPREIISNPVQVSLEEKAFTIIDWLYLGDDFAATPKIMNHFKDEMRKAGGILVIFTQLRDDYSWYAKNMIRDVVSLSARYRFDDEFSGKSGNWEVDKIRDAKGDYLTYNIPCEYDGQTKIFRVKDL